jgi:excisionase family DNA binding protein
MSGILNSTDELGAMTVKEFCASYKIGNTLIYDLIKRGDLRAVKVGRRTLILKQDAQTWARLLPALATS